MGQIGAKPLKELTAGDVRAGLEVLSGRLSTRYLQIAKASLARAIRYAEAHDRVGRNIEADLAGTHIGEFASIQPTGREIRVPYSVAYDLRGDQISALRIYLPLNALMEQLTA